MTSTIDINARLLGAVAKWAYPDVDRPHINRVLFAKREIVATDGRRMVIVPTEYDGAPFCVDRDIALAAVAASQALGKGGVISVTVETSTVKLYIRPGVALHAPVRDAKDYPAYKQIIPTERETPCPDGCGLDARYLAAIAEVQEAAGYEGSLGVKITGWSADGLGAMLFEGLYGDARGIKYIIMPVRV
jgi:hypothetical protein